MLCEYVDNKIGMRPVCPNEGQLKGRTTEYELLRMG